MAIEYLENNGKRQVWIFQSNPKYYRILEALQELEEIVFSVSRYRNEIRKGDRALLWVSGKYAGIYAIGYVRDHIREGISPEEDAKFWVDSETAEEPKPRAPIRLEKRFLGNPLLRQKIKELPELTQLDILRQPNATNFRVTDDEWKAIKSLLPEEESLNPNDAVIKWAIKQAGGRKLYDQTCGQILEQYIKKYFEPGKESSRDRIMAWFLEHYPLFDSKTVECHVMKFTTNYKSRIHYGAGPGHDILFRMDDDWKRLRLYRPDVDPTPVYKIKKPKGTKGKTPAPKLSLIDRNRRLFEHLVAYGELTAEEEKNLGVTIQDIAAWQDSLLVTRQGTEVVSPLFLWATEGDPTAVRFTNQLAARMLGNQLDQAAKSPIDGLEKYVWEQFGRWHLPQPHPGDPKWHGYLWTPVNEATDHIASEKLKLFSHLPPEVINTLLMNTSFLAEQQKWSALATSKGTLGPLSRQIKFGVRRPLLLSQFNLPETDGKNLDISELPESEVICRNHVIAGLSLCTSEEWHQGIEMTIESLIDRILDHPLYAAIVQFEVQRMTSALSGDVSAELRLGSDGNCFVEISGKPDRSLWSACKKMLCEIGFWPVTWSANDSYWTSAVRVALNNLEKSNVIEVTGEKLRLTNSFESKIKAHPGYPQNRGEKDFRIKLVKYFES